MWNRKMEGDWTDNSEEASLRSLSNSLCIIFDFSLCDSRMLPNLYQYMFIYLFLWQFFFLIYILCQRLVDFIYFLFFKIV